MSRFDLLIIGPGRGGTSLLAALLDFHPQLEVVFEHHVNGTLLPHASDRPPEVDRGMAFLAACEKAATDSPKPYWGNKITTEQLARLEPDFGDVFPRASEPVLDRFFNQVLAGKKVIFILRDGRSCVRSKMDRAHHSMDEACDRWLYAFDVWRFLVKEKRALCMRYEDLVRAPDATLAAVCDFLALPFDSRMLEGTSHRRLNPDYQNAGFVTSKVAHGGTLEAVEYRLADALRECDYL